MRGPKGLAAVAEALKGPPWTGPVERIPDPSKPSRVLTWMCWSVQCAGAWTDGGSWRLGKCARCGTARPAHLSPIPPE